MIECSLRLCIVSTGAFKSLDLIVESANITSSHDGQVRDTFRVTENNEKVPRPPASKHGSVNEQMSSCSVREVSSC